MSAVTKADEVRSAYHALRLCERSDLSAEALAKAEAIWTVLPEAVWIASARAKALADKVAELAMTSLGQERSALSLSSPAKAGDPVRRDGRD